ncbi:MAG: DNA recombination protein RmuC [Verrucomicrobia bacterium]|nr:DNA recombination protein RmuC [Verrucomicrobiota bacterium]MBS0647504.1 DNA recombination protein RmuC [Verrucomicrobiota bacterium]
MLWVLVCFFGFSFGFFCRSILARYELHKTTVQFKGISADIMKQSNESFMQLASVAFEKYQNKAESAFEKKNEAIEKLIDPVKQSLEKVDQKILELEKARVGAYVSLHQQVESLVSTQKELRSETANLVKALRQPMARGRWGEIQLRRVVEMAGMLEYCDFCQQQSVSTHEGRLRPDLVVALPGGKQIVVDAKAPLEAYLEAIESDDEGIKQQKMATHARQIRHHISELGKKNYWEQFSATPEFVVLFLPGEPFFSTALQHDPQLIEAGVDQKVILATPTTLIALLRAVCYGWRQEAVCRNAEEISVLGKELYKRLYDMNGHWTKLGKNLQSAVSCYNQAIGSFENRVMPQARRFKELKSTSEGLEIESPEPIELVARQLICDQDSSVNN